jgi:predicted dehydrogenase
MSARRPLRFGVLGAAKIVANALLDPARRMPGDAVVTAIAARDVGRARDYAARHGIEAVHARYDDVIDDPSLDVVYIPTPAALHARWTLRALAAGKHVLCEKPFTANATEAACVADAAARAANERGLVCGQAFHWRYHPLVARVQALLASGAIGAPRSFDGVFTVPIRDPADIRYDLALGGGATMDLGCYPLQWLRTFAGETPVVTSARALQGPPGVDVAMDATLAFPGGARGSMRCAMANDSSFYAGLVIECEGGTLRVVNPLVPHVGHQIVWTDKAGEHTETVPGDSTYTHQLRAFVAAVRGEARFVTDAADAVIDMQLIDATYRAAGLQPRGT